MTENQQYHFSLKTEGHTSDIFIGNYSDILKNIDRSNDAFFITDENLFKFYPSFFKNRKYIIITPGEKSKSFTKIENIYCTRLVRNLGHQRAIAIGLVYLATHYDYHQVIVIDADGEDCPADVAKMIAMSADYPDNVIVAQRERRSEGWVFALFYRLYKATFRSLTGKLIDFGNFCLIPKNALAAINRSGAGLANRVLVGLNIGNRGKPRASRAFFALDSSLLVK